MTWKRKMTKTKARKLQMLTLKQKGKKTPVVKSQKRNELVIYRNLIEVIIE